MSVQPEPARPERRAVIHDLGYRPYEGVRHGAGYVAWSLYKLGVRHGFGLGRSGRSKVLPFGLAGLMLLPAVILVGVIVVVPTFTEQIVPYSNFPVTTQLLVSVFVAAQAPVLFSRDIRYHTLALYFARPLRRTTFVLVRYASLTTAIVLLLTAPLLVLYLGGLLAGLPFGRETADFLVAMLGVLLLSALLAAVASVVAAVTPRRGLAVAAIVVTLVLGYAVVRAVMGIAQSFDSEVVGDVAGVFSPYTLMSGLLVSIFDAPVPTAMSTPTALAGGLGYLAVALLATAGALLLLMLRYRKLAGV
jgi:ABC-2 type transport system permease protein